MTRRAFLSLATLTLAVCLNGGPWTTAFTAATDRLPAQLTDREFWTLIADLSESGGTFRSDNLLSNESRLQFVIPELMRAIEPGGTYLGVGPEQNFTYIAALRPIAIFDCRFFDCRFIGQSARQSSIDNHQIDNRLRRYTSMISSACSRLFSGSRPGEGRYSWAT